MAFSISRRLCALALATCLAACAGNVVPGEPDADLATPFSSLQAPDGFENVMAPLPQSVALDPRKVALGARLFRERRLSHDGQVACIDCHRLDRGGANGETRTNLPGRKPVAVNVPSIFNMAFDFRFAWSGRFEDIGEQIDVAMEAKAVMASGWPRAAETLRKDPSYVEAFAALFPDGLTGPHIRELLSVYALSLVTPNSRFDRYLRGEVTLATEEQRGYELFREYGCVSCHQGINVGGNMLQRFGVMRSYFDDRGNVEAADLGLFSVTGRDEDRYVFRVPSLRNVALTAPYFHDGSAPTLERAATVMARYQLGRDLAPQQAQQIAAFLRTLTGELDGRPL